MSHRKVALKESKKESAYQDSGHNHDHGSTKAEITQMVKALESKILKNSDKGAKILSDWIHQGKPSRKK